MSISLQSGARGLERYQSLEYYDVEKPKVDSLWGSMVPKINIISKKGLNKCCSELNFVQKSLQAHLSISNQSGARGLERYPSLKYYNVEKRKSRFTLGLDSAKNKHRIK